MEATDSRNIAAAAASVQVQSFDTTSYYMAECGRPDSFIDAFKLRHTFFFSF